MTLTYLAKDKLFQLNDTIDGINTETQLKKLTNKFIKNIIVLYLHLHYRMPYFIYQSKERVCFILRSKLKTSIQFQYYNNLERIS